MTSIIIGYRHDDTPGKIAVTADQSLSPDVTDVRLGDSGLLGWVYKHSITGQWISRSLASDCNAVVHDTQMEALRYAGGIA